MSTDGVSSARTVAAVMTAAPISATTQRTHTLPTAHLFDASPLAVGDRHHRQTRHADQWKVRKRAVRLDFRQRHGTRQLLLRRHVDDERFPRGIVRIRIRIADGACDADHRLLLAGVVVKDPVSYTHL